MKAVIADKMHALVTEALEDLVDEVVYDPDLTGQPLLEACDDANILIVRSTKVDAALIQAARKLTLIVRAGAGVNNIDVKTAAERAVFVANCPGKNAVAVAELAVGLMIALDRRIPDNVAKFRAGRWEKGEFSAASGLRNRTVGIVGLGQIGRAFLQRALAFELRPLVWSRSLTQEEGDKLGVVVAESLEALLEQADIVSLHLPLTDETRGLFGADLLAKMKHGATFINTSRADLVDEEALLEAVESRGLCVGLDVPAGEPADKSCDFESPLASHPNVYVTHHIGASTLEAQEEVATEVVRVVRTFLANRHVPNCVNLSAPSDGAFQLTVRHRNRVGVLAAVLDEISQKDINVEEMENVIFDGGKSACCFLRLSKEPSAVLVIDVGSLAYVFGASLQVLTK